MLINSFWVNPTAGADTGNKSCKFRTVTILADHTVCLWIVAKRYLLRQKCLKSDKKGPSRILQLSTPYTDHIPSTQHPKI